MPRFSNRNLTIAVSLVATISFGALAWALDDVKTSLDRLPAAAKATILKEAAGAKITEVEQEKHGGVTVYEAEWKVNGVEHEVCVTADGVVIEREEKIPLASAPAAVKAYVSKHFGENAKVAVEKKTIIVYEVEGKVAGKHVETLVSATGAELKGHDDDGHDDEHDDGDDDDDDGDDD
ncbi:MAG: hypothetical protein KDA33_11295 [Phycisphaerales bacterium]|nr:hypothetical protein [Phycisphaerales bacterium]